jgi:hypothetical protein
MHANKITIRTIAVTNAWGQINQLHQKAKNTTVSGKFTAQQNTYLNVPFA